MFEDNINVEGLRQQNKIQGETDKDEFRTIKNIQ